LVRGYVYYRNAITIVYMASKKKKRPVGRPRKKTDAQKAAEVEGRTEHRFQPWCTTWAQAWRPRKYTDPAELQAKIEDYFNDTIQKNWTITGLALYCGFADKKSYKGYADVEGFEELIGWSLMKVEHSYEMDLKHFGRPWTIFALKNMDWHDKQQVESVSLNLSLGGGMTGDQMVKLAERYTKMFDLMKTPDGYVTPEEAEIIESGSENYQNSNGG